MWFNYNMKTRKRLQMLLVGSALLTILAGCTPNIKDKMLVSTITNNTFNEENAFSPITYELTKTFLESKKSFILYAGSPRCIHCINLMPLLLEYIENTKVEMYYLNSQTETYLHNYEYFLNTLDLKVTPTILFIKEGEVLHREVGSKNLKTSVAVNNFFNKYIYTKNYVHIKDAEVPPKYPSKYVTITYDFLNVQAQTIVNKYFYPLFSDAKRHVYIVDNRDEPETLALTYGNEPLVTNLYNYSEEEILDVQSAFINYFK